MILFKKCDLFCPDHIGLRDVFIAGGRVAAIEEKLEIGADLAVEVIDAAGLKMIPGLIDLHVHIAGAGGEGGPETRTSDLPLSRFLEAGITTVIGCLGTDGITRSLESVLMKAKALRREGISCWIYTGAYQMPTPTFFGDVAKDIALIDEVIGVGEVAISDHRSSAPTVDELIRLGHQARVGGMLGAKAGIVNLHLGDAKNPFGIIYKAVERSELKLTQFLPTHITRNSYIFLEAKEYGKKSYIDLTASSHPYYPDHEIKPAKAVVQLLEAGVPLEHITISSDAGGSLPEFDDRGNLLKMETGWPKSTFDELIDLVRQENLPLEKALKPVTSNPAHILKLPQKGRIHVGHEADLVLLDSQYRICHLVAMGKLMVKNGEIMRKGMFE